MGRKDLRLRVSSKTANVQSTLRTMVPSRARNARTTCAGPERRPEQRRCIGRRGSIRLHRGFRVPARPYLECTSVFGWVTQSKGNEPTKSSAAGDNRGPKDFPTRGSRVALLMELLSLLACFYVAISLPYVLTFGHADPHKDRLPQSPLSTASRRACDFNPHVFFCALGLTQSPIPLPWQVRFPHIWRDLPALGRDRGRSSRSRSRPAMQPCIFLRVRI